MFDLIVIAGAPGSGKTTVAALLHAALQSPCIDFGCLRELHLDPDWSNQSPREEQMAFENLVYIIKNYIRHAYKNIIVTDLQDFRVQQIPSLFAGNKYLIASLIIKNEEELAGRIRRRTEGFTDVERALAWNKRLQERELLSGEHRIDNTHAEPEQIAEVILKMAKAI